MSAVAIDPYATAAPSGRFWLLGWQWALPREAVPDGLLPDRRWTPMPPEWGDDDWSPTLVSDQWQLAATCYAALTGELPNSLEVPPVRLLRPECPQALANILDHALAADPAGRHRSVSSMLRALERVSGSRSMFVSARSSPMRSVVRAWGSENTVPMPTRNERRASGSALV